VRTSPKTAAVKAALGVLEIQLHDHLVIGAPPSRVDKGARTTYVS
jgi:hypothetical protein